MITIKEHKRFFCYLMQQNFGDEIIIQNSSLSEQWVQWGWITVKSDEPFQQKGLFFMAVNLTEKGQAIIDFEDL